MQCGEWESDKEVVKTSFFLAKDTAVDSQRNVPSERK